MPVVRKRKGRLTVIAGPMFSGKTSKLVAMVDVFSKMGHKVLVVKPALDTRYGKQNEIHSHDHRKTQALVINGQTPEQIIKKILDSHADKVVFDEVQFFGKNKIIKVISQLKKAGLHVVAAGLLYDYRRLPFGATSDLMGLSDEYMELYAVCQKCGGIARHTQRQKGSKSQVEVGAADKYIAVCARCHRIYK